MIMDTHGPFQQVDVEEVNKYMLGERRWLRSDSEVLFVQDSSVN
ncbi:hypothetical protein [Sphingomonas sp. BK481]|jgi:hypothetical protein|nr:hypothetical protein [Sphingomonas sp. BK481]MBB3586504.1 hypothetical protein [Sphingomonas sp. BK481]